LQHLFYSILRARTTWSTVSLRHLSHRHSWNFRRRCCFSSDRSCATPISQKCW